jgi:glyoxylase-like metal-dependent hydrolase (beta-lactamase superfamily II)
MNPLTLGQTRIERIAEIETMYVDPDWLYQNVDEEMLHRHKSALGPLSIHPETLQFGLSYHSYLIRTRGLNILVDTCNGNGKLRPSMPEYHNLQSDAYLQNLARLGLTPEDIDYVLCTHLHTDHVGWNTRLVDGRWVPTFPRAKYLMARPEFEHFNRLYLADPTVPVGKGAFQDSVLPIVEAGQAEIVEMNHSVVGELDDGVWMEAAPGHTPGHVTIHVKGGGRESIMTGDIIHHPILILESSLETRFDMDKKTGDATRQRLLERLADTNDVLLTAHFCSPTAGRVMSCAHGFRFSYLDR